MGRLFLLFTLVPILELFLLVRIGEHIGALPTVALVLVTGALGASLARRQGTRTMVALRESLARGELPARHIADGALIFIGGVLLVTPGVLTDIVGLLLLLPATRRLARRGLLRWMQRSIAAGRVRVHRWGPPPPPPADRDQVYDATLEDRGRPGESAGERPQRPRNQG